ncbi:MAG: Proton/glutamate-aspartate symporter [Chlamydiia bacterium]|nr:Proton/glutamate-aspartate symporter [Chlamydiia bacterium]
MKIWVKILIGLGLGIAVGLIAQREFAALNVIGQLFISALKMLVGLIVFSSIVTGVAHIHDPKKLGRIGGRALLFYLFSTLIAIGFGLVIAYVFEPGSGLNLSLPVTSSSARPPIGLGDFVVNIVPSNPFQSFAEGNVLQVIVFALFFSYAVILSGEAGKPILKVLESVLAVMFSLTHLIMEFAPYGIFALIATSVGTIGFGVLLPLAKFLFCNYLACLLQIAVIFTIAIKLLAGLSVAPFFRGMKDAIVVAFTTSSSSATLPVSIEAATEHLGISEDISGFVMSLGSTINMNGGAIGLVISSIFISQAYGLTLTSMQIVILIFTALISAIGAAGIPGTGVVMLSIVLNAMGLPLEGIALVVGVDRIREMVSTVVNILGDGVATLYVARKEKQIDIEQYHHTTWYE